MPPAVSRWSRNRLPPVRTTLSVWRYWASIAWTTLRRVFDVPLSSIPTRCTPAITSRRRVGRRGTSPSRSSGTAKRSTSIPNSRRRTQVWGSRWLRVGRYEDASESFARAVSLRPGVLPINDLDLLADALRRQQRYEEAIETYRSILNVVPEYDPGHAGIGYALYELKRYQEAIDSLARSDKLQPESRDAADRHVVMGRASAALGRTEAAAEHFARVLEMDARNAEALDSFAVLRFRQQRYEEALGYYEKLVEIGEANARVHANMGVALYYLERPEEALRNLDLALSL